MVFTIAFKILTVLSLGFIAKGESEFYNTHPIQTDSGLVVGEILTTVTKSVPYAAFKGIPYAEPPINNLRFKPPVAKQPWTGILYATSDRDRCIQMDKGNVIGSEDCLYLNVYSPNSLASGPELKPVIVWIHGGAFTTGHSSSSYYGPDFLLEADVVVVAMNYRLGPLGFLNINHDGASGNYGLKDQNLALQWVQRNIHNFRGDPQRVTLFGQSAGGVSVDLHKLSDMSSGLFSQTISMSASPLCKYWAFQSNVEAQGQAFLLGSKFGLKSKDKEELLDVLMSAPAADIIKKAGELPLIPFRPTLEKSDVAPNQTKFLTECTPKRYHEGRYNKGPHLMGFTSLEILSMVNSLDDLIQFHENAARSIKNYDFIKSLPVVPKILSTPFTKISEVKKAVFTELIQELSDIYFVTGIDMKQRLLSKHNQHPVFYYRFTFKSSSSAHKSEGIQWLDGVAHEDELPHLFYRPHLNLFLNDSKIEATRERLVQMWTNFAKYGNPTPEGEKNNLLGVTWPDSGSEGTHLQIDETLTVGKRPTNLLITLYQKFGFGDSNIYNDCDKTVLSDIVNGLANIPGKVIDVIGNTAGKVSDTVSNAKNGVVGKTNNMISDTKNSVDKVKGTVTDVKNDAVNKTKNVITDAKNSVDKFKNMMSNIF